MEPGCVLDNTTDTVRFFHRELPDAAMRFEVDPARARADIEKFLTEIADLGLLQ